MIERLRGEARVAQLLLHERSEGMAHSMRVEIRDPEVTCDLRTDVPGAARSEPVRLEVRTGW